MIARAMILDGEEDRGELLRWFLAGIVILAAHLALVLAWILLHRAEPVVSGAPVVMVELAPLPSAPAQQTTELTPEVVEPQPTSEPDVPPEPQAAPPQEVKAEPSPPSPVPEVVTETLPPPREPAPHKPEEKRAKREPAKKKAAPAPRAQSHAAAPAAPQLGLSAQASTAQASWRDLLVAHLQRHKRYPGGAQARHEQGTVLLSFSMDRSGHVLARSIARSSGVPELDQEVLAMIQRAQPLPAFPPAMPQTRMSLTVPIRFSLR